MYKEELEDLKINQVMKVFENPQVWRNNATRLHKETEKVFQSILCEIQAAQIVESEKSHSDHLKRVQQAFLGFDERIHGL
jgi:hypothetical protein